MNQHTLIDIDAIDESAVCQPGSDPEAEIIQEIGSLMPVLQHRWRLRFENDEANLIARQVTKLTIDYVKMEIAVSVVQPAKDIKLQQYMMDNAGNDLHIYIDALTGKGNSSSKLEFEVVFAEHKFVLDYASDGESAKHEIILKIR